MKRSDGLRMPASAARCVWRCATARSRQFAAVFHWELSSVRFHFLGAGKRLLYARADSRAAQVIAGQENPWNPQQILVDGSQDDGVVMIVLRKHARHYLDVTE